MKNMPNIPATERICTRLAPVMLRERKIRSGTSGVCGRRLTDDEGDQQHERDRAEASVVPEPQPSSAAGLTIV